MLTYCPYPQCLSMTGRASTIALPLTAHGRRYISEKDTVGATDPSEYFMPPLEGSKVRFSSEDLT
jgi:hypothetical protein